MNYGNLSWLSVLAGAAACAAVPALAAESVNLALPQDTAALTTTDASHPPATAPASAPAVNGLDAYFDNWWAMKKQAQATQPEWSSPIVTTTPMLENRYRLDVSVQHVTGDTSTINADGGKGLDLIVGPSQEIQIGTPPYVYHYAPPTYKIKKGKVVKITENSYTGFADYGVFRFKQRLVASPADQGNYIVSAWLQVQLPTGITKLTNHAVTLLPTIGAGKGFGAFDIQANAGAVIPTAYEAKIGIQVTTNIALQYHLLTYFWPQIEFNNTYYSNGSRSGKDQLFFTPGLVMGRIPLGNSGLKMTLGVGYQTALEPKFQPKPILPAYDHGWIVSSRFSF